MKTNIDNEIETRIRTNQRLNRSISNKFGANNYDVIELPLPELQQMKEDNETALQKLYDLKRMLSPFKNIIPKVLDEFKPGAILTDSWGWEQTNIDFYCIVARSGEYVTLLPMTKETSAEIGFMTNYETAGVINFTASPIRKKVKTYNGKEHGFTLRNYSGGGWCRLWDGKEETSTHYA